MEGKSGSRLHLSITATPPGSQRPLERKDTVNSQRERRWNAGGSVRSSNGRRESLGGSSLLSLKAYYRKLRTFKGTVKALINLRRVPTLMGNPNGSLLSTVAAAAAFASPDQPPVENEPPKAVDAVVKLTDDEKALQTVQTQVKDLVDKGHVVTELGKDGVTYRMQGNLEHYTEENLRKRVRLQQHPHMIALTQRLWLAANHEEEEHLSFGEYEAYMLRLHRLILPEFDVAQSKELIHDDWARDTDGSDHLDFRYFHFSMFELVDLWTDTVDAEDYISLLYCTMHCLTFEWNDRYLLKDLEDIQPVDILEASKEVTQEEIKRDLAREVNGDLAQLYRDRVSDGNVGDESCDPLEGGELVPTIEEDTDPTKTDGSGQAEATQKHSKPLVSSRVDVSESDSNGGRNGAASSRKGNAGAGTPANAKTSASTTKSNATNLSSSGRQSVTHVKSSPSKTGIDQRISRDSGSRGQQQAAEGEPGAAEPRSTLMGEAVIAQGGAKDDCGAGSSDGVQDGDDGQHSLALANQDDQARNGASHTSHQGDGHDTLCGSGHIPQQGVDHDTLGGTHHSSQQGVDRDTLGGVDHSPQQGVYRDTLSGTHKGVDLDRLGGYHGAGGGASDAGGYPFGTSRERGSLSPRKSRASIGGLAGSGPPYDPYASGGMDVNGQGTGSRANNSNASHYVDGRLGNGNGSVNQHGSRTNAPFSITSLGAGSQYINMGSRASLMGTRSNSNALPPRGGTDRPSMIGGGGVHGLGLQASTSGAMAAGFALPAGQPHDTEVSPLGSLDGIGSMASYRPAMSSNTPRAPTYIRQLGKVTGMHSPPEGLEGVGASSPRYSASPSHSPHSLIPRSVTAKETEARPSALVLVLAGEQKTPQTVHGVQRSVGNLSPRAQSARYQAMSSATIGNNQSSGFRAIGLGNAPGVSPVSGQTAYHMIDPLSPSQQRGQQPGIFQVSRLSMADSSTRQGSALSDYLQTRAIHEASIKIGRPPQRPRKIQQQRISQTLTQDLAIVSFASSPTKSTPTSQGSRHTMIQPAKQDPRAFIGSVVGLAPLAIEPPVARTPATWQSLATPGHFQANSKRAIDPDATLRVGLGLLGASARLEAHAPPTSPRKSKLGAS